VLCEKPLALNVKQAEAMLAAAQKAKITHMVGHNYRRVPAIAQAKKLISEGAIGEIYHYHGRYAQDWLVDPEAPMRWKLDKNISGSGALGDIQVHLIDLARYLVGEFTEVCGLLHTFVRERPVASATGAPAKSNPERGKVNVDDTALFMGRFERGALANLESTRYAPGRKNHMAIEINGARGSLCFDLEELNRLKYYDTGSPPDRQGFRDTLVLQVGGVHPYAGNWWRPGHALGYEHTFVHAAADFVNACVDGKSVAPTFEDGLRNQRVLEAMENSAKTRKWVPIKN
jgi:predicted dehydrogenase